MKTPFQRISLIPILSLVLQSAAVHADSGTEFVQVPVDVSKNCSTVILKGTQRFKGIGFVTPKVFLSVNKNGERLFEILPVDGGEYLIRMGLYIPLDASSAKTYRPNDSQLYVNTCDFDQIRVALAKKTKTEADPIITLAPLPIRKLEVKINGIRDPFVVGSASTDLLDYLGMDQVVEFRVNQAQLKEIIARLNGGIGLGVDVAMSFKARTSAGYIDVKIDQKKVEKSLELALKGRIKVAYADLAATVKSVLQTLNINVYQEGDDQAMNQLVSQIMNQFLGNHPEAVKETAPVKKLATDDEEVDGSATVIRKPLRLKNDPVLESYHDEDPKPAEKDEDEPAPTPSPAPALVNVKAFLNFVKTEMNLNLKYQKMGAEEDKNITTSTIIHAEVQELTSRIHRVSSMERKTSLNYFLKRGNQLNIAVVGKTQDKLVNLKLVKEQLLSKDDLLDLYGKMKKLPKFSLMNRGDIGSLSTDEFGSATLLEYPNVLWSALGAAMNVYNLNAWSVLAKAKQTRWTLLTRAPVYAFTGNEKAYEMTQEALAALPLKFTFAKVGSRTFKFQDLFQKNPYFEATYDSFGQKIMFKVLQPLGQITLYDEEVVPTKKVVLKSYHETTRSFFGDQAKASLTDGALEEVPAYQTRYSIRIDQAGKNSGYLVTPSGSSSSNEMLSIPQL